MEVTWSRHSLTADEETGGSDVCMGERDITPLEARARLTPPQLLLFPAFFTARLLCLLFLFFLLLSSDS